MNIFDFDISRLNVIKRLRYIYALFSFFKSFINVFKALLDDFVIVNNRKRNRN